MGGENRLQTRKDRIDRNQTIEPRRGEKVSVRESAKTWRRQALASATRWPGPGGRIEILMILVIRSRGAASAASGDARGQGGGGAGLGLGGDRLLRRQFARQRERRGRWDVHRRMFEVARRRIGAASPVGLATSEAGQRREAGEDAPAPSPDRLHGFPLRAFVGPRSRSRGRTSRGKMAW